MATMVICVATGVTSSLFASLLPAFRYMDVKLIGVIRETNDPAKLKHQQYLTRMGVDLVKDIHHATWHINSPVRYLWLSTQELPTDARELGQLSAQHPTLAIGSGAMLDFYKGHIDLTTAPMPVVSYVQSKVRMALTKGVTTLLPGFFIEDDPSVPMTPSGLHRETSAKIRAIELDESYNWSKPKYVTPKTFIVKIIVKWCLNPTPYLDKWYHCGSDRAYNRWELRHFVTGNMKVLMQHKYPVATIAAYKDDAIDTANAFGMKCSDEYVKDACIIAFRYP